MVYAALCAIAKDEDPDIREWVDYHTGIGFEHIYLYDNGSALPLTGLLTEYVDAGLVTVIDYPETENPQLKAYAAALRDFGGQCAWMGFIDIDEFIVPKAHQDIKDLLDRYTDFGGLAIHWKLFGSGGHKIRPEGGVARNYTRVLRHDGHIKSIVRPERVAAVRSPHHMLYADGWFCVNEDKVPVSAHHSYHVSRTVQINHYYYKSFEDFVRKMDRGLATPAIDGRKTRDDSELAQFSLQLNREGTPDTAIIPVLDRLGRDARPIRQRADEILGDCRASFATFSGRIAEALRTGGADAALAALRACLRYHDIPAAWDIASKFYLLAGQPEQALTFINRQILDYHSPYRTEAFKDLSDYYRQIGDAETARVLERHLADA